MEIGSFLLPIAHRFVDHALIFSHTMTYAGCCKDTMPMGQLLDVNSSFILITLESEGKLENIYVANVGDFKVSYLKLCSQHCLLQIEYTELRVPNSQSIHSQPSNGKMGFSTVHKRVFTIRAKIRELFSVRCRIIKTHTYICFICPNNSRLNCEHLTPLSILLFRLIVNVVLVCVQCTNYIAIMDCKKISGIFSLLLF